MTKITENDIELFAVELLARLGYDYIYAPELTRNHEEVLLKDRLLNALEKINPSLPYSAIEDAIKQIERIKSSELLSDNETFHKLLVEGVKVDVRYEDTTRGEIVHLVDFDDVKNNDFVVANQFTITENGHNKRPDIILFVNGLPLVVMELKNAVDKNATVKSAYNQIGTYKSLIPSLFTYNAFCIISDGIDAKAGTLSAGFSRYMAWKTNDGVHEASNIVPQIETLINGMLNPRVLLDLVRSFIVFEKSKKEDTNGIVTIETVKKLAAYHQYYAVNKAVERTLYASSDKGDKKGGVVWHTQGSGKSLSMVFYTGKIVLALDNPTVLVITDRNDLDDQLFDTFASCGNLLRQEPMQIEDREDLKQKLKVASGGVIFTTIQKFQPEEGNVYDMLSDRKNIVVIADEAHRTQYGFKPKVDKDTGEIKYGFAKYLRDALPNATYLGFTRTPIESTDVNTPAVFGDYVDIYDISQAVEDGATVKIYYESRLAKINLSDEGKELVKELDDDLSELDENQKAKAKWTRLEALIGSKNRIKEVAADIVTHFEKRQEVFDGKGMIVSMSRRIAVELYDEIIKLRPAWHHDDLDKGVIKVIMTASSSDGVQMAKHHTSKKQRRDLANRMKNVNDELKLVIVRDMWLTGFDAPSMHTLYIDKPMRGHNLMQAIARVNRVYQDKPGGLVVDYLGIASDLKKALSFYSDSGGKGDPALAQEKAVALMLEKLEIVSQMFHGFAYERYFGLDTRDKLSLILEAQEHILGLIDGKKRYIEEVTALSSAFAIAVPHEQAMDVKDEVAFFQAVKARLTKFESKESRSDEEIETTIRQVIDKALVTEQVIDIFDASGIKKPDISILSDEFLLEVKNMKHKNIALEVLKILLNDEIKARSKTNLVQSKSLMAMLENSIKKYHNKIITAVEVIDELINIGKDIKSMDKEPHELGLSDFEYAFYTAVANNESAKELMSKEVLRELAVVLTQKVRENASIDWTIKESVRAKLKIAVKRVLRQFGYPPDMQALATETVLKQAEMIADELTK
jgi:type I restriction enzyme R subunit